MNWMRKNNSYFVGNPYRVVTWISCNTGTQTMPEYLRWLVKT